MSTNLLKSEKILKGKLQAPYDAKVSEYMKYAKQLLANI